MERRARTRQRRLRALQCYSTQDHPHRDSHCSRPAIPADPPCSRDKFDELIALATSAEAPFDAIVVWKTNRMAVSLEDTIALRDQLRRAGTRLLSVIEKGIYD